MAAIDGDKVLLLLDELGGLRGSKPAPDQLLQEQAGVQAVGTQVGLHEGDEFGGGGHVQEQAAAGVDVVEGGEGLEGLEAPGAGVGERVVLLAFGRLHLAQDRVVHLGRLRWDDGLLCLSGGSGRQDGWLRLLLLLLFWLLGLQRGDLGSGALHQFSKGLGAG